MKKACRPFGMLFFFYIVLVASELVLRFSAFEALGGVGLWFLLGFALPPALVLWLLAGLFPRRGGRVVAMLATGLIALLFCSQLVYYHIFHTFYVLYSVGRVGQVLQFWQIAVDTLLQNWVPCLVLWVPFLVCVTKLWRFVPHARLRLTSYGAAVLCVAMAHFGCTALLPLAGKEPLSPYDLYFNTQYLDASVSRLGLLQSVQLDAGRLLLGFAPLDTPGLVDEEPPAPEPPEDAVPVGPAYVGSVSEPEAPAYDTGPNTLDIDFETLAAAEKDQTVADMHQYFSTVKPTLKNARTGEFEGNNLIFLTAEAFAPYAVDPVLTPTLYKLVHEGIYFSNYYTPGWGVSTSDGEYVALQSLIPMSGVWSMYRSSHNLLPFTLGNQLRAQNYSTRAYHNNTFSYYGRDESHPNLGYIYKGLGNGLTVRPTWPQSDLEMVDYTTNEFVLYEPFHAYYMTVSGHMLYSWSGNFIASKNRELVEDLPYSEAAKAYLACNIELDRALELLLKRLEEAGVAERTVIAMTADHYPYGLTQSEIEELTGAPVEQNFELYHNNFVLYKKGMKPETVDKPMSSLDILPTLSNLFGLPYDSRLMMGRDIFSNADPLVIFANRSWISNRGRYHSLTGTFTPAPGFTDDSAYTQSITRTINDRFYYSGKILEKDYFAKALGLKNDRTSMFDELGREENDGTGEPEATPLAKQDPPPAPASQPPTKPSSASVSDQPQDTGDEEE